MKNITFHKAHNQTGIALIMALIMLLLITIIGVASVRMTKVDTQLSGNSMFSLMVFQGAESALGKIGSSKDISNIREAAKKRSTTDAPFQVPDSYFTPADTVNDGAKLTAKVEIIYEDSVDGLYGNIPNSTGSGGFINHIYRTTAESRLSATAAKAIHIEGIAIQEAQQ